MEDLEGCGRLVEAADGRRLSIILRNNFEAPETDWRVSPGNFLSPLSLDRHLFLPVFHAQVSRSSSASLLLSFMHYWTNG